jgi:hypothetical protein
MLAPTATLSNSSGVSHGFPLIEEFELGGNFRLDDRAIWVCDGDLETDSRQFHRPDSGHCGSPWFKVALRLHIVDSARARYRGCAAGESERLHSGPGQQYLGEDGNLHECPKPQNRYKAKVSAT